MIGSFLVILILFLLLLSKTPMVMTKDTINFLEVMACIEALESNVQNEEEYDLLRTKYITIENQTQENSTYEETTYGMLTEILNVLDFTGNFSKEYIGNTPKDKFVERDEFFSLYDSLIEKVGKQNEIVIETEFVEKKDKKKKS